MKTETIMVGESVTVNGRKLTVIEKGSLGFTYRLAGSRGGEWLLVRHESGRFWTLLSPALKSERVTTLARCP